LSAKTIRESVKEIGIDETAKKFNLARESVRRYNRQVKNAEAPTEPIDNDKAKLLERVSAQFSTADLRAMLNEPFKPSSRATKYDFSGDKILFGVASDWHIGSAYTDDYRISALAEFYKKEGASLLLIPGDLTEGMSGRDGHVYELKHIGYKAQKAAATEVHDVKEALAESGKKRDEQLNQIQQVGADTHQLVNGSLTAQMKIGAVALRRLADNTKHSGDIAAAELAEKTLQEHIDKQPKNGTEEKI